jgi:hypothetical protein
LTYAVEQHPDPRQTWKLVSQQASPQAIRPNEAMPQQSPLDVKLFAAQHCGPFDVVAQTSPDAQQ